MTHDSWLKTNILIHEITSSAIELDKTLVFFLSKDIFAYPSDKTCPSGWFDVTIDCVTHYSYYQNNRINNIETLPHENKEEILFALIFILITPDKLNAEITVLKFNQKIEK